MDSWGLLSCHASWMGEPRPVRHRWTTEEYQRLTSGLQTHAYTHSYTHKLKGRSGKRASNLLFAGKLEELVRPHVFCCLCDDFPYCVFTMIWTAPPLSYNFKVLWGFVQSIAILLFRLRPWACWTRDVIRQGGSEHVWLSRGSTCSVVRLVSNWL